MGRRNQASFPSLPWRSHNYEGFLLPGSRNIKQMQQNGAGWGKGWAGCNRQLLLPAGLPHNHFGHFVLWCFFWDIFPCHCFIPSTVSLEITLELESMPTYSSSPRSPRYQQAQFLSMPWVQPCHGPLKSTTKVCPLKSEVYHWFVPAEAHHQARERGNPCQKLPFSCHLALP